MNASERYWTPETTQGQTCLLETSAHSSKFAEIFLDGKKIAYFRGRKLVGKQVALPEGYRGTILLQITQEEHSKQIPRASMY